MLGDQALVVHLAHLILAGIVIIVIIVIIIPVPAPVSPVTIAAGITALSRATLPQRHRRQMRDATGLLGSSEQHLGAGTIDALECVHSQAVLGVLMFERHREFLRIVGLAPLVQQSLHRLHY